MKYYAFVSIYTIEQLQNNLKKYIIRSNALDFQFMTTIQVIEATDKSEAQNKYLNLYDEEIEDFMSKLNTNQSAPIHILTKEEYEKIFLL